MTIINFFIIRFDMITSFDISLCKTNMPLMEAETTHHVIFKILAIYNLSN